MIENDKNIRKGLPPRRDRTSFQTLHDIVIPAGTILRAIGDDQFAAKIGFGDTAVAGEFSVTVKPSTIVPATALRRVVAA